MLRQGSCSNARASLISPAMRKTQIFPSLTMARTAVAALLAFALVSGAPALARSKPAAKEKAQAEEPAENAGADADKADRKGKKKGKDAKGAKDSRASNKPEQLATFGAWGAYATSGKDKTCYALGAPKAAKGSSANVFISTRPGDGVKNEVAISLGFAPKDGSAAKAAIDDDEFELVTKGANAWIKTPSDEPKFVKALKEGSKLVVTAPKPAKGKGKPGTSTDTYSLEGLSKALDRVMTECK